jgi:hypothetical protein
MVYPVPNRVPFPIQRPNPMQPRMVGMAQQPMAPQMGQQMPQQRRGLLDFAAQNPEMFLSLGAGLLGGQTGAEQWAGGLGNMAQTLGAAKEKRETQKQKNATIEYLKRAGADPELIGLTETGALSAKDAYDYHLKAQTGKKPNFINAGDGNLFNADSGEWISAPGGSSKPLSTVGKIIADFNAGLIDRATRDALISKASQPDQMKLTTTDKKAILEADDMVAANENALNALDQAIALSDKANSGWLAGTRGALGNNLPDLAVPDFISSPESSVATADMDNAVIGQALSSLKAIFGGMPTEGERKILLDLQGSSTMPREVRKQVFERAKAMAQRRLEFNRQRADSLRGGTYYNSGGAAQSLPQQGQGRTQSGITFTVEP